MNSLVYFIQNESTKLIKVGFTTDISRRFWGIRHATDNAPISILGVIPHGDLELEKRLHSEFDYLRVDGEWFHPGNELTDFIMHHTTQYDWGDLGQRNGKYVPGPGRDPFDKEHGEKAVPFKLNLTVTQHEYLKSRSAALDISMAEYLRKLIAADMAQESATAAATTPPASKK